MSRKFQLPPPHIEEVVFGGCALVLLLALRVTLWLFALTILLCIVLLVVQECSPL